MTIPAQSSGRNASVGIASGVVWLLASGLIAACSLLAPGDQHYLSGTSDASGEGGESGKSGESGGSGEGGQAGGDHEQAGGDAGSGGVDGLAAAGGLAGSDAGGASGGTAPLICGADLADCNQQAGDGCEVDLSSSSANCGGCGEVFACAADEVCEQRKCVSRSGCSDGTREAFLPVSSWPHLAGCTAQWPRGSLRSAKSGSACGYPLRVCEVPADACGNGWHVCAIPPFGPAEVSAQATADDCAAQPGAFAAAVGDQSCEPCTDGGNGAACCGDLCVQQHGSCIYSNMTAWIGVINGYKNVCGAIESDLAQHGVLCCRAP